MIGGCAKGEGGVALGVHNANTKVNDDVRAGASRGLMSDGIEEQIAELTQLAESAGQKKPIKHAFASPPPGAEWNDAQWNKYWKLYEKAQGLEGCPFSESIHDKPGDHSRPEHRHRVYLAITARGTLVRNGNDYIKQEAVSRITEFDTGSAFIKGKHNVRAERAARKLGRDDVADAMMAAGLLNGTRAIADLTPENRAQQERTGIPRADVARGVAMAWAVSDNGPAFTAALAERGLRLAMGNKCPVVLDEKNGAYGVLKMLAMDAKAQGMPIPKAKDINPRLAAMDMPFIEQRKEMTMITAKAVIVPTDTNPKQPTPSSVKAPVPLHNEPKGLSEPLQAVAGAGGNDSKSLAGQGGGTFASDVIEGPGEPPGPGAGPLEIQEFRKRLMIYEDKKAAAVRAAFQAQQQGGNQNVEQAKAQINASATGENNTETGGKTNIARGGKSASVRQADFRRGGGSQGELTGSGVDVGEIDTASRIRKPEADGYTSRSDTGHPRISEEARDTFRKNISDAQTTRFVEAGLSRNVGIVEKIRKLTLELNPDFREARRVHLALRDDRNRISNILSSNPFPNPVDIDPQERAARYAGVISDGVRERAAQAASANAEATRLLACRSKKTKMLSAFGIRTPEQKIIDDAVARASTLTNMSAQLPSRDDYSQARADGVRDAHAAQKILQAWKDKPEVAKALDDNRLNQVVQTSVRAGDTEISAAMKNGDPELARSILCERERVEELRRIQLENVDELTGKPPNGGPKRK